MAEARKPTLSLRCHRDTGKQRHFLVPEVTALSAQAAISLTGKLLQAVEDGNPSNTRTL